MAAMAPRVSDAKKAHRLGSSFLPTRSVNAIDVLARWLDEAPARSTLLVLDIGAGFHTPGVIRWPMEKVVRHTPRARLIRVNPEHPEVPADLGERALSIPLGADPLLSGLVP